jgi:hypothetical protein
MPMQGEMADSASTDAGEIAEIQLEGCEIDISTLSS